MSPGTTAAKVARSCRAGMRSCRAGMHSGPEDSNRDRVEGPEGKRIARSHTSAVRHTSPAVWPWSGYRPGPGPRGPWRRGDRRPDRRQQSSCAQDEEGALVVHAMSPRASEVEESRGCVVSADDGSNRSIRNYSRWFGRWRSADAQPEQPLDFGIGDLPVEEGLTWGACLNLAQWQIASIDAVITDEQAARGFSGHNHGVMDSR